MKAFKTALKQARRTPYQALIAILILSLTFFFISSFALIMLGSYKALQYFESAPQVIAFFEKGKDLSQADIDRIKNKLEATGKVDVFKYVSTKDAEKIYKEKNQNEPALNELVDYRILPPSIEVSAVDLDGLAEIKKSLDQEELVVDLFYYEDVVADVQTWINNITYLGAGLIGFMSILSILILIVIIGMKVKNKRSEIEIIKLLGASSWQIRGPFLFEGVIYGFLGSLIGWLLTFTLIQYTTPFLVEWLQSIITIPIPLQILLMLLGSMSLVGMILGALSSLMAVRRFSRV